MKRAIWIFLLAVLLPVLALAAMALRAARHEQAFLERQMQESARALAALIVSDAETELAAMRQEFAEIYREVNFVSWDTTVIEQACREFLRRHPFARLIFVLDSDGTILLTATPESEERGAIQIAAAGGRLKLDEMERNLAETKAAAPADRRKISDRERSPQFSEISIADDYRTGESQSIVVKELARIAEPTAKGAASKPAPPPAFPIAQQEPQPMAGTLATVRQLEADAPVKSNEQLVRQQSQALPRIDSAASARRLIAGGIKPQAATTQGTEAEKFREQQQAFFWNDSNVLAYSRSQQRQSAAQNLDAHGTDAKIQKGNVGARQQETAISPPHPSDATLMNLAAAAPPAEAKDGRTNEADTLARTGAESGQTAARLSQVAPALPTPILVESRLQPQFTNVAALTPPVVAMNVSFRELLALGQPYSPRVTNNELNLLLYVRDSSVPNRIAGCEVNLDELRGRLQQRLNERAWPADICAAVLNDKLQPVALSVSNFTGDWKRPLVAETLSDALPHWAAAIYSLQPGQLAATARWASSIIALSVFTCLAAIFVGTFLMWREATRERRLAQQKADFVTNITHELQTPLANIRLFSEMLGSGAMPEKQREYASILVAETERLGRLINNVLDFARDERQRKWVYQMEPLDIGSLVREVVKMQQPRLENGAFKLAMKIPDRSLTVKGDRNALSGAILNLLSNAEKYSNDHKEIDAEVRLKERAVEIVVMDRGVGVPADEREKIFEPFHRAHDQLNSGTSGTGLGLTLSRRTARDHGGDLWCKAREGGGSAFILELPLAS